MRLLADILGNVKDARQNTSEVKKRLRILLKNERDKLKLLAHPNCWGPMQVRRAFAMLDCNALDFLSKEIFIASYFPIQSELNLNHYKSAHWIFPRVDGNELLWFFDENNLVQNQFGIPEAPFSSCFHLTKMTEPVLMFVPCLAVSKNGIRLGYGGGYYDRLLKKHREKIVTIACVHSQLHFDYLPSETFDISVDCIATEENFYFISDRDYVLCKLRT